MIQGARRQAHLQRCVDMTLSPGSKVVEVSLSADDTACASHPTRASATD